MKTALLLSGGIDSTALAFWKKPDYAFTVDYGQLPVAGELRAARAVSQALGIPHIAVTSDCSALGSGDLSGNAPSSVAPATDWWPYRNQLLITLVAMKAIDLQISTILIGTVRSDSSHTDGTREFIDAIDHLMSLQEGGIRILAPAADLSSAELVTMSKVPPELLAWSHSCHRSEFACGECRGCIKHKHLMRELGYDIY